MERHVQILRNFRDRYLLDYKLGQKLVNLYYQTSPPIAEIIEKNETLRLLTHWILMPMVGAAFLVVNFGVMSALLVIIFAFLTLISFVWVLRIAYIFLKGLSPEICTFLFILTFATILPLCFSNPEAGATDSIAGFEIRQDRPLMQNIPAISLSESDLAHLSTGKPVTRLLDTPGGFKACYMRIFLPYDPPTIWSIVTDIHHFSMVSPQYPKNGSLTDKRQTFMPYVFDSCACGNDRYLYQLIVMPFIAPRQFTLKRSANRSAFPWESKWSQEPEMRCRDKLDPQMEKYRTDAVITERNEGSWRLSPLSKEFIKSKEDLLKTDCIYYVDTNPGGNLSSLMPIVNKVSEIVLPALAENLIFHAKQWDEHMRQHHPSHQYEEWKAQVRAYKSQRGYTPDG